MLSTESEMESHTTDAVEGSESSVEDNTKMQLVRLFGCMFTKQYVDSNEYLQANLSAESTISLDAVMMATEVRAITIDSSLIVNVLHELKHLVEFLNEGIIVLRTLHRTEQTTLILRDISSECPIENVFSIFSSMSSSGCPYPVSVRSDVADTWFVCFATEEEALTALKCTREATYNGKPVRCRIKTVKKPYFSSSHGVSRVGGDAPSGPIPFNGYPPMFQPPYPMQYAAPGYGFPPMMTDVWPPMMVPPPYGYASDGYVPNNGGMNQRKMNRNNYPPTGGGPMQQQRFMYSNNGSNGGNRFGGSQGQQGGYRNAGYPQRSNSYSRSSSDPSTSAGTETRVAENPASSTSSSPGQSAESPRMDEVRSTGADTSGLSEEFNQEKDSRSAVDETAASGSKGSLRPKNGASAPRVEGVGGAATSQRSKPSDRGPLKKPVEKTPAAPEFNLEADFPSLPGDGEVPKNGSSALSSSIWGRKSIAKALPDGHGVATAPNKDAPEKESGDGESESLVVSFGNISTWASDVKWPKDQPSPSLTPAERPAAPSCASPASEDAGGDFTFGDL